MEDNMKIYNLARSVPENAKRIIGAGRLKGFTDVNPMFRIKALTEIFGPCGFGWYYEVTDKQLVPDGDETCCFIDINLYVKQGDEWSKPIYGTGGSRFKTKERSGVYISDECFKMALTDAISVASKSLGIGADVYWQADRTKYSTMAENVTESRTGSQTAGKAIPERLKPVFAELKRTGYTAGNVCRTYKLKSIEDMSDMVIKDFLKKIANVPTKEQ